MRIVLKNADVFNIGKADIAIENGIISDIGSVSLNEGDMTFDLKGKVIFPGFVDVHTHLREPGFSYKETIKTGTKASARGGFTHVFSMPNLNPVPDCYEGLKCQLDIIKKDAVINVIPFGSITKGQMGEELADFESMSDYVAGFSDDGRGVQDEKMMLSAMNRARELNKVISAHCEDNSLLRGGYIHDGEYAKRNNHKGISSESEWGPVKRDVALLRKSGCKYHVCHISAKETVEIIRNAKKEGLDITCETAPHYLVFNDMMISDEGRFKMNPPIRGEEDRVALIEGVIDGTVDMIATDHAPHSFEEKNRGLAKSLNGIVGIETSFSAIYTHLVRKGIISLERLVELMSINPSKRFGLSNEIKVGNKANLNAFSLDEEYEVNSNDFLSMGKSSPFDGQKLFGQCVLTISDGKVAYQKFE